jgi:PEGA domain
MDERPEDDPAGGAEDVPVMPKWVPAVIGVVLVTMASLAVYTGLRYRNPPLANGIVKIRRPARPITGGGAPGEPGPGGSLVLPGESGDNAPSPNAPIAGHSKIEIDGAKGAIAVIPHFTARRGMTLNAVPEDAMVFINDTPVGTANQIRSYEFPAPGSYTVRIVAPGYKDEQVIVSAADNATPEVVTVNATLRKQ